MKWLYTLSIISLVLVCLQPTQAFDINIVAGPNQTVSGVQVSGQDIHIITSSEIAAFNLTDQNVINYIASLMNGVVPDDYAFSDPTDSGNNYAAYGYPQVTTTLTAVNAEIISFTAQPIILATKDYINNSTDVATFDGSMSEEVTNTVETSWSETNTITATQEITYGVSYLGGSTSLSYSSAFEQGGSQSQATTVGTDSGFTVTVNPGQTIEALLSSTQGTMTVRVYFQAVLNGYVYFHYDDGYEGHYYWFADVNEVTNMIPMVTISEDITISFFSESQILLKNLSDMNEALVVPDAVVGEDAMEDKFLA